MVTTTRVSRSPAATRTGHRPGGEGRHQGGDGHRRGQASRDRTPPGRHVGRTLHPGAWWAWALGVAAAATLTTNPLLLLLLGGVVVTVVLLRREDTPWGRAIWAYLALAGAVVLIRLVFAVVFGTGAPGTVLFALPRVPLPGWATGISLGGPVTAERLLGAFYDSLRLAVVILALGGANALANPKRLLRTVPGALHDVAVAVVVAVTVAPQLVESTVRVRRARRLRGGSVRGLRAVRAVAVPVLADAVERSLALAAAMESRGFGSTRTGAPRGAGALLLASVLLVTTGGYLLLTAGVGPVAAVGVLACGVTAGLAGLALSGRRVRVTRYRPDAWGLQEWLVLGAGVASALLLAGWLAVDPAALRPAVSPPAWPALPPAAAVAVALAALPGLTAPRPRGEGPRPRGVAPRPRGEAAP